MSLTLISVALVLVPMALRGEISSVVELNRFFSGARPDTSCFSLTGTVTYVVANDRVGNFILRDGTGSVNLSLNHTHPLKPGDFISVS